MWIIKCNYCEYNSWYYAIIHLVHHCHVITKYLIINHNNRTYLLLTDDFCKQHLLSIIAFQWQCKKQNCTCTKNVWSSLTCVIFQCTYPPLHYICNMWDMTYIPSKLLSGTCLGVRGLQSVINVSSTYLDII